VGGGRKMKEIKVRESVDGLHILIQNRTMKPTVIALSSAGGG
jgi:hypothetical protein